MSFKIEKKMCYSYPKNGLEIDYIGNFMKIFPPAVTLIILYKPEIC